MGHLKMDISGLFQSAEETTQTEEVGINGNIPTWLRGSYLQIGPGKLDFPNFTVNDWLDGYGIITKFEIKDGPVVTLDKKFVQSEALQKAVAAGKPFFTEYGTTSQTDADKGILSKIMSTFSRDDMSDNCSASLYQIGTHVCAAAATCYFRKIDPKTLMSGDRFDAKKFCGQNGFGVHPLTDDNGDIWNMGFTVLPTLKYNLVKIPCPAKGETNLEKVLQKTKTIASISSRWNGAIAFNHSFGMTKNHIIFIEQPYVIKVSRVLSSKIKGYAVKDWLEWNGPQDKNRFYVIEKDTGKWLNLEIMSQDAFFFLHFVNCYQDGNQIIVDIATSKDPSGTKATSLANLRNNMLDPVENSRIQRFIIPLQANSSSQENQNLIDNLPINSKALAVKKGNTLILTPDDITEEGVDRLSISRQFLGKKYTHVFTAGAFISNTNKDSQFFNSVCKVNVDTKEVKRWFESNCHFPGEPLFIPKGREAPDEKDGVIICPVETVDPNEDNFLLFLDAKSFLEIGRASFKNRIPGAVHGIYLPSI